MLNMSGLIATALLLGVSVNAATITETFESGPQSRGWQVHGDTSFFQWNATNGNLEVTWDSRQSNSLFYHKLGTILSKHDDFGLRFDLRLNDLRVGLEPDKPYAMQVAVGFLNSVHATSTNFLRATGMDSPNVVTFDYFADTGFGASVSPAIISSNNQFGGFAYLNYELTTGVWFSIDMHYWASNQTLVTTVTSNGVMSARVQNVLDPSFTDFRVDIVSINSYSDAGQFPGTGGSLLAHGTIDNIHVTVPASPLSDVTHTLNDGIWRASFNSLTSWVYTLERSADFTSWSPVDSVQGTGGPLELKHFGGQGPSFYRMRAERP